MKPQFCDMHHGDCLEVMREMRSCSVDIVFTSPPYNLRRVGNRKKSGPTNSGMWPKAKLRDGYDSHSDDYAHDEYARWQRSVLLECWRLLKDDGMIFYNHKPRVQLGLLQTPLDLNPGLPLRQIVIWYRKSGMNFSPSFYIPTHEWVCVFAKPDARLVNRSVSQIGDVWTLGPERYNPHPAPFPVELPLKALQTVPGDVVLDPFMGSGTTGVACLMTGKRFIGIDNSKEYYEMAKRRLYLAEQGDYESWNMAGA